VNKVPLTEDEKQEMKFLASAINGHEPQGFYAIRERLIRKFGYNRFRDLYVGAAILTRSSKLTPDTPEVVQAVDESARRPGGWQEDTHTVDPKKVARRNGLTPAQNAIMSGQPSPYSESTGRINPKALPASEPFRENYIGRISRDQIHVGTGGVVLNLSKNEARDLSKLLQNTPELWAGTTAARNGPTSAQGGLTLSKSEVEALLWRLSEDARHHAFGEEDIALAKRLIAASPKSLGAGALLGRKFGHRESGTW
jgi:hypothetical protein